MYQIRKDIVNGEVIGGSDSLHGAKGRALDVVMAPEGPTTVFVVKVKAYMEVGFVIARRFSLTRNADGSLVAAAFHDPCVPPVVVATPAPTPTPLPVDEAAPQS